MGRAPGEQPAAQSVMWYICPYYKDIWYCVYIAHIEHTFLQVVLGIYAHIRRALYLHVVIGIYAHIRLAVYLQMVPSRSRRSIREFIQLRSSR